MAKVLILIASLSKRLSRQLKHYFHFKISKNTHVFPVSAKKELVTVFQGKFLLESEFPDQLLDEKNKKLLAKKNYSFNLEDSRYRANFPEELRQLETWYNYGVATEQILEYKLRVKALADSLQLLNPLLFNTVHKEQIEEKLKSLEEVKENKNIFKDSRANLKKISHTKDETFNERVLSMIQKPTSLQALSKKLDLKPEYVRSRLNRLIRAGKVKRTEKLGRIGRPPYIYFLSESILSY